MSRFISAGTILPHGDAATPIIPQQQPPQQPQQQQQQQHPNVASSPSRPLDPPAGRPHMADTSTEWAAVQKELEDARRARAAQRSKAAEGGERSLYEVLQANKAAKQAAFEEQTKIRNQFRALDDDEIEFLDEVKAAKRMEEERVRRELEDGLRAFREQQRRSSAVGGDAATGAEGGEDLGAAGGGTDIQSGSGGEWGGIGRKRKRGKKQERIGLVKRKAGGEGPEGHDEEEEEEEENGKTKRSEDTVGDKNGAKTEKDVLAGDKSRERDEKSAATSVGQGPTTAGVASKQKSLLVSYGSDDSDDD
ncbi:hypothetical protein E4U55_006219 [Claviceps digitariae]|nr:hypothetical protein E4U55_006219 [Claviceps digitariae]